MMRFRKKPRPCNSPVAYHCTECHHTLVTHSFTIACPKCFSFRVITIPIPS